MVPDEPLLSMVPSPEPAPKVAPNVMPPLDTAWRSMVPAEPVFSIVASPEPAPAWSLPKVMPPLETAWRSMVPDEPLLSMVPSPEPAPKVEPKVMPPFEMAWRSMVLAEPLLSMVPRSCSFCSLSCSVVHSRLFAFAKLLLPNAGTEMLLDWQIPPRLLRQFNTLEESFASCTSRIGSKHEPLGRPRSWQPFRNIEMLFICCMAKFPRFTFFTAPGTGVGLL